MGRPPQHGRLRPGHDSQGVRDRGAHLHRRCRIKTHPRSPCQGVKLPEIEQTDKRYLSPIEVQRLTDAISPRFRAFTAAYTGGRFGELAGLRRQHYEPLKRIIRIERNLTEVRGRLAFGETKTRASRRAASIPTRLVDVLAEHLATYPGDDDLIFTAPAGGPLRRASFALDIGSPK